eukprot:CAMPEP_0113966096 /NCGR_PEP_ID=MMETSP0011_2-20120614/8132_1 /TAXON_ID=101924 /ORGANISM="Rhodosorus marinus" /LENGTH=217 /DNA_ID=CAMNT_0000978725 /DNA_START=1049 /DNA_END=1698 /DNA_ORIENTATION=- /assembly_acc=CAM_ASM_000156
MRLARVILIRHGESEANTRENIYIAGRDFHTKLTLKGREQALELGSFWRDSLGVNSDSFSSIYSSPATRALETANLVCEQIGVEKNRIRLEEALLEIDHGEWEEGVRDELYTEEVKKIQKENPYDFKAPGGESQRNVEGRVLDFLMKTAMPEALADPHARPVLVFTHGFVIKSTLRHVLDADPATTYKTLISNVSATEVGYHVDHGWHLLRTNSTIP